MNEYQKITIGNKLTIQSLYTFFQITYEPDFYFNGESHNFWEVVFVTDGTIGITAGNQVFYLHAGQVFFHKPMEFHQIWPQSGKNPTVCIISFDATNMPEIKHSAYNLPDSITDSITLIYDDIKEIFNFDKMIYISEDDRNNIKMQMLINRIEMLLLKIICADDTALNKITSQSISAYARIISVLDKNISNRLTLEEIASLCNMSVSSLKKNFCKYSQTGIIKYFNLMKINRAKALLMAGKSVKETANMLGFEDQNYFSTMFKRLTNQSPGTYKP